MTTVHSSAPVLKIDGLRYRYPRARVEVLRSLTVESVGRSVAVLGPNGAGKSTLIGIITGARKPVFGTVEVIGFDVTDDEQRRALQLLTGYVPQTMGIYPGYTVEQFLAYACWLRRVPARAQPDAIGHSLDVTDLSAYRRKKIRTLSGGARQRVKIAQALVNAPRLLILDEPTVGLDPEQRAGLLELIARLADESAVLLTTHLVEDAARLCEGVMILQAGWLAYAGSADELAALAGAGTVNGASLELGYRSVVRYGAPGFPAPADLAS